MSLLYHFWCYQTGNVKYFKDQRGFAATYDYDGLKGPVGKKYTVRTTYDSP